MKDTIRSAVQDAVEGNPQEMGEKVKSVLFSRVSDALKIKKLEVAHTWLNGIVSPDSVEPPEEDSE